MTTGSPTTGSEICKTRTNTSVIFSLQMWQYLLRSDVIVSQIPCAPSANVGSLGSVTLTYYFEPVSLQGPRHWTP